MKKQPLLSRHSLSLVLFLSAVLILSATPLFAAMQTIQNGTSAGAIRVAVQDVGSGSSVGSGAMAVWRCGGTACNPALNIETGWTRETYGPYSKGSILFLGAAPLQFTSNAQNMGTSAPNYTGFAAVSNTNNGDNTITTVFTANSGNVRITQNTSVHPGDSFYKMRWDIENVGPTTYTNVRFVHGEDTFLDGVDGGIGHFDTTLQMVYISSVVAGSANMMGMYADPSSPFSVYFEGLYSTNFTNMRSWTLNNSVNATNHDAAYSLGWTLGAPFAPGDTWTITAYEKFMRALGVMVIAPAGETAAPGATVTYPFLVQNLAATPQTISLSAISEHGWALSIEDASSNPISSVNLAGSGDATVYVRVTIPTGALDGAADRVTLTGAAGGESGADSTTTTVAVPPAPVVIAPPGGLGEPGDTVTYPFVVKNPSSGAATIALSAVSAHGWSFTIQDALSNPITSVAMAGGDQVIVYVLVSIPMSAVDADTDLVTLTATTVDGSGADSATTTVFVPLPLGVTVTAPGGGSGTPGDTARHPFTVKNLDPRPAAISFALSAVSGNGWAVSIQDNIGNPITSIPLVGNAQAIVYVLVSIPAGATDGFIDPVTLTASTVGASDSDTTNTTVLVRSLPPGPITPPSPTLKSGDLRGNGGCGIGRAGFDSPATSAGLTALYLAMILAPVAVLRWRRVGAKKRVGGANKLR